MELLLDQEVGILVIDEFQTTTFVVCHVQNTPVQLLLWKNNLIAIIYSFCNSWLICYNLWSNNCLARGC